MGKKSSKNRKRTLKRRTSYCLTSSDIEKFSLLNTKEFAFGSMMCFFILAVFGTYIYTKPMKGLDIDTDYEINRATIWQKLNTKKDTQSNDEKLKINPTLKKEVAEIVKGSPMEEMTDEIAKKDRAVAAYLVGIAMKESKFGKYSPKKNGTECYNYWGYRGKENTTKSGYSCFSSPEHAISVVGGKISKMLAGRSRTPAQMISWKCGSSCAGHDPESVKKWIADVAINYYKLNPVRQVAQYK